MQELIIKAKKEEQKSSYEQFWNVTSKFSAGQRANLKQHGPSTALLLTILLQKAENKIQKNKLPLK